MLDRTQDNLDALLTELQASEILNLSTRTLQAWRLRHAGPAFIQAGRAVRYRRRDLCAWIDANTVGGSSVASTEAR
ncbi:MAG: helix-turn-helix domain-containing protein [Alphaproteobacteria bacterium]|nr:MAG: helix-turn-helix domain-containing protein [Alphaproteobacteria bacterium]